MFAFLDSKREKRTKLILILSDIDNPFLRLYLYRDDSLVSTDRLEITPEQLDGGAIVNCDQLADRIRDICPEVGEMYLLVDLKECFKDAYALPKISEFRGQGLFHRDFKDAFPRANERYVTFTVRYTHPLGSICYTHFIPSGVVTSFKRIALLLGARLKGVDILGHHLFSLTARKSSSSALFLYEIDGVKTMALTYDDLFISSVSYAAGSEEETDRSFLLYMAKHEFELEKRKIERIEVFGDSQDFEDLGYKLPISHQKPVGFDRFLFRGIALR